MGAQMFFREDAQRLRTVSNEKWEENYAKAFGKEANSPEQKGESESVEHLSYQRYLERCGALDLFKAQSLKFRQENHIS